MKKVIFGALALGMIMFSCQKENLEKERATNSPEQHKLTSQVDNNDYSQLHITEDGVLEFETIEYYENLVSAEEDENSKIDYLTSYINENLKFNSLATIKQNRSNVGVFEDDFMNSILDNNYIVKIDKWFIRVNPLTEKIYVASNENINAYELVSREDDNNLNVYTFTFDEEVLSYLKDEELLNDRKLFCKDKHAHKQQNSSPIKVITDVPSSLGVQMQINVKFHKYGIYYTLKAKGTYGGSYPNYLNFWFQLDDCSYHQRCGSSVQHYSHPWISAPEHDNGYDGSKKITYNFYSGVKDLKSYSFKVRLRCESTYNVPLTGNPPYYVIFTQYAFIAAS